MSVNKYKALPSAFVSLLCLPPPSAAGRAPLPALYRDGEAAIFECRNSPPPGGPGGDNSDEPEAYADDEGVPPGGDGA